MTMGRAERTGEVVASRFVFPAAGPGIRIAAVSVFGTRDGA
jgi:hypothetical protein